MFILQGTVKKWIDKGYGFIKGNDGIDYFVHWRNINNDGFKALEQDQTVEFTPEDGDKGPRAVDVSVCK